MPEETFQREGSLRAASLLAFAFLLIIPLLNVELTYYRSALKLFAFQSVVAAIWGLVLFDWAAGRLRSTEWPAWWLFAPVGAWVLWGLGVCAWSRDGWLGAEWVVQGASGAVGAAGLAVLLSERGHRHMFAAAASVVVAALALYMAAIYGDPQARFLGDLDLSGREAGAAFLLLPTVVTAAALYQLAANPERNYRAVVWATVALLAMLLGGLRTGSRAWLLAVGLGVAVAAWMMVPRWRLVVALLVVLVVLSGAQSELTRRSEALNFVQPTRGGYWALLDKADWRVVGKAGPARLIFGSGIGSFFLALDRTRPPETYAARDGDKVIGHARRQFTEVLYERGLVGLALALACGLAWVIGGWLVFHRADNAFDSALGAGLAAGGVALGAFVCFSNGGIGFAAALNCWFGLALLGALAGRWGRPAALAWSDEEGFARAERGAGAGRFRSLAACVAAIVVVALWWRLGLRPFWGQWCLRDGDSEAEATEVLAARARSQGAALALTRRAGKEAIEELKAAVGESEKAAKRAAETLGAARKQGVAKERIRELEKARAAAEKKFSDQKRLLARRSATLEAALKGGEATLAATRASHQESLERARSFLETASRLALGGRVWLNAQLRLAVLEMNEEDFVGAATRLRKVEERCGGPAFDLAALRAQCYVRLRRRAEAHALFKRYAVKNPFAVACAIRKPRTAIVGPWFMLIAEARGRKVSQWRQWARDFIEATSRGLALDPENYALLSFRGEMRYLLGQHEGSRSDMAAADRLITRHLVEAESAALKAKLLIELANVNSHWNKDRALKAAQQVLALNLDWRKGEFLALRRKAARFIEHLRPPRPSGSAQPADVKPPKR